MFRLIFLFNAPIMFALDNFSSKQPLMKDVQSILQIDLSVLFHFLRQREFSRKKIF